MPKTGCDGETRGRRANHGRKSREELFSADAHHQLTGPFGGWMFGDPNDFNRQAHPASRVLRT
jgi:hypothetical protein